MDITINTPADFFKYCSLINGGLLLFSVIYLSLAHELVYRVHTRFFALSRAHFQLVIYGFLGIYKLLWIVFNVVPFIALQMLANS